MKREITPWRVVQPLGTAHDRACGHLELAELGGAHGGACAACLTSGRSWVNLLVCMVCGTVGCCDSSPGQHAYRHYEQTGHPLARTLKSGEAWGWCFVDEVFLEQPDLSR
jgi:CPA1 family monovalent cation:H+ antiporter